MFWLCLLGIFTVIMPVYGAAVGESKFVSGNRLLEYCSDRSAGTAHGVCLGYVQGVYDGALGPTHSLGDFMACVPEGVEAKQMVDVVSHYLTSHPERRQFTGSSLVADALSQAFPCK
jgi:hypothetical protein